MTTTHLTYFGEITAACGQGIDGVNHTGAYAPVVAAVAQSGGDACVACLHLLEPS